MGVKLDLTSPLANPPSTALDRHHAEARQGRWMMEMERAMFATVPPSAPGIRAAGASVAVVLPARPDQIGSGAGLATVTPAGAGSFRSSSASSGLGVPDGEITDQGASAGESAAATGASRKGGDDSPIAAARRKSAQLSADSSGQPEMTPSHGPELPKPAAATGGLSPVVLDDDVTAPTTDPEKDMAGNIAAAEHVAPLALNLMAVVNAAEAPGCTDGPEGASLGAGGIDTLTGAGGDALRGGVPGAMHAPIQEFERRAHLVDTIRRQDALQLEGATAIQPDRQRQVAGQMQDAGGQTVPTPSRSRPAGEALALSAGEAPAVLLEEPVSEGEAQEAIKPSTQGEDEQYAESNMHLFQGDDGVQAWIRDAKLNGQQVRAVAQTMARELAQQGNTLAALTVNGRRTRIDDGATLFEREASVLDIFNRFEEHDAAQAAKGAKQT